MGGIEPTLSLTSRRRLPPGWVIARNPFAVFDRCLDGFAADLAGVRLELRIEVKKLLRLPAEVAWA